MNTRLLTCFLAAYILLLAHSTYAQPDDNTVKLTLASWNVENFFDAHDDPYTSDEGMTPTPPQKLSDMAAVIRRLNPDFLGVVEMETEGALHHLVHNQLSDLGYDNNVFVSHRDFGRGINNGGITRIPIDNITLYRFKKLSLPGEDHTWYFARDLVCFQLLPAPNVRLEVFVIHLKSKRDSENDPKSAKWRLAEATELRKIIDAKLAADPNALIALVGDFNDTPDSPPIQTLLAPAQNGSPVLIDVLASFTGPDRDTFLEAPYISPIDYILVSPALAKCLEPGSAIILKSDAVKSVSDHAAISAKFAIPVPAPALLPTP